MRAFDHVHGELALARAAAERAKQRVAVLQQQQRPPERSWQRAIVAMREHLQHRNAVEDREDIWEVAMRARAQAAAPARAAGGAL